MVAGLQAVQVGAKMRAGAAEVARATELAEGLLVEVASNYVGEPSSALIGGLVSGLLGIDSGENPSRKQTFDDVDDYAGWSESPPQYADGTTIAGFQGWTRAVQVVSVSVTNPEVVSGVRTGLVRISVRVTTRSGKVVTLSTLRADAMQSNYAIPNGKSVSDLTFVNKSVIP